MIVSTCTHHGMFVLHLVKFRSDQFLPLSVLFWYTKYSCTNSTYTARSRVTLVKNPTDSVLLKLTDGEGIHIFGDFLNSRIHNAGLNLTVNITHELQKLCY